MCGIFGVHNARKAAELTVIGLHGIQHRAMDAAAIVSSDGSNFYRERGPGLARQVFSAEKLDRLHGMHALGHIRYPTVADDPTRDNTQPIVGNYAGMRFCLAHNGNITNTQELLPMLSGHPLATSMDSEFIVRLIELRKKSDFLQDLIEVCRSLKGSFSLGILLPDALIAVCDSRGNRPLSVGKEGSSYFLSSETAGFGGIQAARVCDVEPGEIIIMRGGFELEKLRFASVKERRCRFEGNYFAHPSSVVFGEPVDQYRRRLGHTLEKHCPSIGADIVTPVPDSGSFIAMGYAESGRSGTYAPVIIRSHYVGRTFIAATQARRDKEVAQKFSFSGASITGKRIVVVDDSVVRGTTLPKIVGELRRYGAKEVHVRIGSPEITHPCRYGINTPTKEELISSSLSAADIRSLVGADSLEFLPLAVQRSLASEPGRFCYACMDGEYWE